MEVFGMSNKVVYMATVVRSYKVLARLREMSIPPVVCSLLKSVGFSVNLQRRT